MGDDDDDGDAGQLYWSAWICGAPGGYEHHGALAYCGDPSHLLLQDRETLKHRFQRIEPEVQLGTLLDELRGLGHINLRGNILGFAILAISKHFQTANQAMTVEEGVMFLGLFALLSLFLVLLEKTLQ